MLQPAYEATEIGATYECEGWRWRRVRDWVAQDTHEDRLLKLSHATVVKQWLQVAV